MSPFCMFDHDDCPKYIDGFCAILEDLPRYDRHNPCPFFVGSKCASCKVDGKCYKSTCNLYVGLIRERGN